MQSYVKNKNFRAFDRETFISCQQEYSTYLLGEVRDEIEFYFSDFDFDEIIGFFGMFRGRSRFNWGEFKENHIKYVENINQSGKSSFAPLMDSPEKFLQFLYSLNIIGYLEVKGNEHFVHWCFRDRSQVVLSPKVQFGCDYMVHPGLVRALKLGQHD